MNTESSTFDAVVVGAGVAGMYAVYRLRRYGLRVLGFESASRAWTTRSRSRSSCSTSGTGARNTLPSRRSSTTSSTSLTGSSCRDFRFDTRVTTATFDDDAGRWRVTTDAGHVVSARFCIFATGCLSAANVPDIIGREDFAGEAFHTGRWPREGVDFGGKRVGVVGTGSSGIQSIPLIAEQAKQLYVFQRSANYSVPAGNRTLDEQTRRAQKAHDPERRRLSRLSGGGSPFDPHPKSALAVDAEERRRVYEQRWHLGGVLFGKVFPDQTSSLAANDTAREFAEAKIRALVHDPEVADRLIPTHPIGTKRIVTDTGYYDS